MNRSKAKMTAAKSSKAKNWFGDSRGSTAIAFATALPAIMALVGVSSDYAILNYKRAKLQSAADQAAISAAREFSMASSNETSVKATAETFARADINAANVDVSISTEIDSTKNTVKVEITENWAPFFAHFISQQVTPIKISATAGLFGESKICVLALNSVAAGAVLMTKESQLQADDCTVYSNSSNGSSVYMGDTSAIKAKLVCTVGGVKDNGGLNADQIVTDCPILADPLAGKPIPPIGACDATKTAFTTGTHYLKQGVYCGGISASGDAIVKFDPGVYIIKDGPLLATDKAQFLGKNVGFYTTGTMGLIHFMKDATIDLSGREDGEMAGMLFYDNPAKAILRVHSISARNAHTLTGTIYMANGNLIIDPTAVVGAKSAYTAIVANRLMVQNGPTLVLNSDYSSTPVPVPEGIRIASDVHLVD